MIVLFALLLISTPIYVSLALSTSLILLTNTDITPLIIVQRMFGGIDKFALMAMPFFVLAANAMDGGGLSRRILRLTRALVGHISGGAAMTTQVASMFFGALSGSAPATVVAIGKIMYPELLRSGLSKTFAGGLIASSGSISLIIPPSITLIIFATVTNTSVGALFMGGLTAGVVFGLVTILYLWYYAKKNNLPKDKKASTKEVIMSIKDASWALLVPVIILGGIYFGYFTATEAAGVSALYSLIVGAFIYKEITFKKLYEILLSSAVTSAQLMILVAAASAFAWFLTVGQVPQSLAAFVINNFGSKITFLLFINLILLVTGMFIDGTSAVVILAPLLFPAAVSIGIDPIHFGVVMIVNLAIGMYTPPFGLNIFIANSITEMTLVESLPGIMRFIVITIIGLLIITYIPQITTFLPYLIY